MLEILFKNVGQGDSILLEWSGNDKSCFGIIDCHQYNSVNQLLQEVKNRKIEEFEFIFLSHLHHDHYSGMGELLEYCTANKIIVKRFYHTFTSEYLEILEQQFLSVKQQSDTYRMLDAIKIACASGIILDIDEISQNFAPINLYGNVDLKFLAPIGIDKLSLSAQHSSYKHKTKTTRPDFNVVATIIQISNGKDFVLLTSDAPKKNFRRLRNKITLNAKLIQVPHHGSPNNLDEIFWQNLKKDATCTSVFSVGESKKDKIPKKNVVEFFEKTGYYNMSTNYVYGLEEFYGASSLTKKNLYLGTFTRPKVTSATKYATISRFRGDKRLKIAL